MTFFVIMLAIVVGLMCFAIAEIFEKIKNLKIELKQTACALDKVIEDNRDNITKRRNNNE